MKNKTKKPMKRPILYFLIVIVLLSIVLHLHGEASAQILIQNESTVDVTPSGFSVIWQATENTIPGISVFADSDGNEEITNQLETILFPLHGGNPEIIGEYDQDIDMANIRARAKSIGLVRITVKGCLPETTYYYRISSEGDGGEIASVPTGSLIAVTTTRENSFIADSKQILVSISDNSGSQDHIGLIVKAYGSDTLYGVSSIVGDGAPSDHAYINLSNLFGPDMRNWTPIGLQQISLEVMIGGGSDIVSRTFDLEFSDNLVVSTEYTIDVNVSGTVDDTDGDGISDNWEITNFGDLDTADETTDFDNDGLLDKDEYANNTDPDDTDSDNDSIPDGYEVANGLNPLVDDCNGDADGDNRTNCQEYLDGTDPNVFNFDITNITQDWETTDDITIMWESVTGLEYQIASKDDYTGVFNVVDTVTASGESTSWIDDGTQTGTHPSAVQQRYYKIIQDGVDSGNIVGMYMITVNEGMNLISLPLVPFSTALEDVIGVQVTGSFIEGFSDRLWVWDGTRYKFAWQVDGTGTDLDEKWHTGNNPTTITLGADQGAWLQIRPGNGPVDLYFLGEVSESNRTIQIKTGMNLVGTSYPVAVNMADTNLWESGLTGAGFEGFADRIWSWESGRYEFIWLADDTGTEDDGQWFNGSSPVDRSLKPGSGYWIQRREGHPAFDWDYPNH